MNKTTILLSVILILGLGFLGFKMLSGTNENSDLYNEDGDTINIEDLLGKEPVTENTTINTTNEEVKKYMNATLHTNKGDITIEFFAAQAPNTVANFTKLAHDGFYDGVKFHRVIPKFMIQGGDPNSKDDSNKASWGMGGPGYKFADEISATNRNDIGTISMANSGPNTNGSQFFINVANNNFLDPKHTVFGKVTAGMDSVKAIENTPTGEADRPIEAVVIKNITLK